MKTMKLVVGIISIVLSLPIFLQSCTAVFVDAISAEGGTGAASGMIMFLVMLSTGIVAIATRNSRGAAVYCFVTYAIAGLLGISVSGAYKDLIIWGFLSIIFAILFFISLFTKPKQNEMPPPPNQYWNYPHH